ncbi:MAG: 4Fe-4S binding protein [Anaerolineae bacterium]|nr:MAG: 4Fe-4S binding protein [Anaerolineae bacterium]
MNRVSLLQIPWLKAALKNRWPQFTISALLMAGFVFAIVAGLVGTPVGSRNFGIIAVWIAWWAILILAVVPVTGRGWCSVCPIPMAGDFLQRRSLLGPNGGRTRGLNLRLPKLFRNIWWQNAAFALMAIFSAAILTNPRVTALALIIMLVAAIGMSAVFERRSFCKSVCPVGGFIGLYSQVAPLELRVADAAACASCASKACYNGSEAGYGCPWGTFPAGLTRNPACGLCLECLRSCPNDNIVLNLRPFAADLEKPAARLDEAFKAFLMLGAALVYAAVFLGPWGNLKVAALAAGTWPWLGYAAAFLLICLALLPGLFWVAVRLAKRMAPAKPHTARRHDFAQAAAALVPLGLAFWAAFSLSFVFANGSYLLNVLSDPLGWGWDLFGTAGAVWSPLYGSWTVAVQVGVLALGAFGAARVAQRAGARGGLHPLPVSGYSLALTVVMMGLLL